ncbi:MAG: GNAT family N-acetyltransferase [Rhodothermales bacterium]|nr:GNAT family N-acetyltransferase [Rhodothermales bacterium]
MTPPDRSGVAYRQAGAADAPAIASLWRALMDEHTAADTRFVLAPDAARRWANDVRAWLSDTSHRFVLAEIDDRPVGFIHGHRWRPIPLYDTVLEVFIGELYVMVDERRAGIGGRLLTELHAWARDEGAVRLRLGVLAANAGAAGFWETSGARPLAVEYTIELKSADRPAPEKRRPFGFFSGT